MRSYNQKRNRKSKITSRTASILTNTVVWGLTGKQWTAAFLICLLLLPLLTTPAGAFEPAGESGAQLPVNEKTGFLEGVRRAWNVKFEEWTTPWRPANREIAENDEDGKIKKTNDESRAAGAVKNDAGPRVAAPDAQTAPPPDASKTGNDRTPSASPVDNPPAAELKNAITAPPVRFDRLPTEERNSVYSYDNNLGSPLGQVEKDSSNPAAALRIQHRAGIANFSFNIPVASLAGRGIDAGVGLNYNSRTWNLSCQEYDAVGCSQKHFTYDVEQSWIAPGFSTGFGYLESNATPNGGVYKIIPQGITDADGTRHQLFCRTFAGTTCTAFETADGTFVKTGAEAAVSNLDQYAGTSFTAVYPNGVRVYYTGGFGGGTERRHYPVVIQDANGNRLRVAYRADQSGRIDYLVDTLNRKIRFYYENDANGSPDKLVAVTIPGMSENSEIQAARFYYQNLTLNAAGKFDGQLTAPASIRVLQYVFIPATRTGYKFEYDPNFGMIRKITRQAGMTAATTALNTTGTLTEGVRAASTEYNYPDGATVLDDVPKYTRRIDDWQGRTASAPQVTDYHAPEPVAGEDFVSQITVPENGFDVRTENRSYNTGDWQHGLLKETSVTRLGNGTFQEKLMSKTVYFWAQGTDAATGRRNPRLRKIDVTNEAGLVKTTEFEYDQYNNQTRIKEYDYGAAAALLRTTEIEYETGAGWIGANLLRLQKSLKTVVDNAVVSKTLFEYDHNGSDESLVRRPDIDIRTHDTFYNPDQPAWEETVCPDGSGAAQNAFPERCTIIRHPGYSAASAYRGNLTRTIKYKDGVLISDLTAASDDFEYDIAGNLVTESLSCCNQKTIAYDKTNEYAFPVSETKGVGAPQLTVSRTYNRNTGLVLTKIDENDQVTGFEYEADTLRLRKTSYPNGGSVIEEYSDKLVAAANDQLPGFIRSTTMLDAARSVQTYRYFDGRGSEIRNAVETPDGWSISAVEFDRLGRPAKSFNPYYGPTPTAPVPSGAKFTEVAAYDALGRSTAVRFPDNSTITTVFGDMTTANFNKPFVTITDQAGRQRRQVFDALGRVARIDEPGADGGLGPVDNPARPTVYEFDGNDNLKKISQSEGGVTQERMFKHDAQGNLTHERQVEALPTLDADGVKQASGGSWTAVRKYNDDGLLTDGYDARGVHAQYSYDALNRIRSVTFSDGTPAITYTYDQERPGFFNKGALTRIETAAGGPERPETPATAVEFDYDRMGRVVRHRQSIGSRNYELEYAYNLAGLMISEKYPSGKVVAAGYDAGGRLNGVSDQDRAYLSAAQYGQSGGVLSALNFGNGTREIFDYNDRLQLTGQTLSKAGEVLQKYEYGYGQIDADGNFDPTKNDNQLARIVSYIGTAKQWTETLKSDALGRLSEVREYRGDTNGLSYRQKFDFDRFGNLYRKQAENPTAGQENPLPFTPIESADVDRSSNRLTTGTVYDEAGNVTADNRFRSVGLRYDANGRVVRTIKTGAPDALTVYNSAGSRVAEKVNDVWRFMVYDIEGRLVAEYGGPADSDEGGVNYVLEDHQGSVRALSNNAGFVETRIDYQAFGGALGAGVGLRTAARGYDRPTGLRPGFGLTESDDSSGLAHTLFRKYENQAGRWTSPDPFNGSINLADPQSLNRYSYVGGQPSNFIDPSGLQLIVFTYLRDCTKVGDLFYCRPGIFVMNIPDPSDGAGGEPGGGGGGGKRQQGCPVAPLKPLTEAAAQRFEEGGGNEVDFENLTAGTRNAFDCLQNAVVGAGGTVTMNSGYRSQAYQSHLLEVYDKYQQLRNNNRKECQALKQEVTAEFRKHNIAERPAAGVSNHTRGTAFDLSIGGVRNSQINAFARKCGLRRRAEQGRHHFDFVG